MADWQEGDVVTNPDTGEERTLTKGQWVTTQGSSPSVGMDMAKSVPGAIEKTGMAVATAPNTIGGLAAKGINAAGDYAFPDWKTSGPGKVMGAAEKYFEPKSYSAQQQRVESAAPILGYQPQTLPGKITAGAAGALPFGLIGEGAMAPNMVRAALSGGASEAAGQATQGSPWEVPARMAVGAGTYGLSGAVQTPRIIANTPVKAAGQTLENSGVRVPASALSGSRVQATLEGGPMSIDAPVSDAMKQQGGVVRPPGNTDQFSTLLNQRRNQLQAQGNQLGAQTAIPATPQLRQQLATSVGNHLTTVGGVNDANDAAVTDGLRRYDQLVMGQPALDGTHYQALRHEWNSSGNPTLRNMAGQLDTAMDAAHPGAWNGWRQNWADYEGLQAAAGPMGGAATAKPLDPKSVVDAMHRRTPMRDTAEAAQTVQAAQPQPYDFSKASKLLGGIGAAAGLVGGAYHGGLTGAGEGTVAGYFGLPGVVQGLPVATGPVFRSSGGQNAMRNLDPRVVSGLLAQQGVRLKGTPGEQPQETAK